MEINIRQLSAHENPPMELLLTADPSQKMVEEYLKRGRCFVAEIRNQLIGVHVLLPTRPHTIEIVNIAVVEEYLKRGRCFVAEIRNQLIGVHVLLPTRPHTIEIVNIAVDEKYQGSGIGKFLLQHAIETAQAMGYGTIEIGTGNSSIGQLALYQKCGFRIVGVDLNFFLRHYEEDIIENGIRCTDMIRLSQDI